jgi:ADP-ribosylglycohydrolase
VFDAGLTTYCALDKIYNDRASAAESGCPGEDDNGNGSLMRMLPVALYFHDSPTEELLARAHEISAITHAHPRSKVGCGIYCLLVQEMLTTRDKELAYHNTVARALAFYSAAPEFKNELSHFMRIISFELPSLEESEICSSGYLVDTLEAALWCTLTHSSTKDVLLSAVNLGLDTDTTGMVAGGMAGALYGLESVPADWLASLARKDEIDAVLDRFVNCALVKTTQTPVAV